MTHKVAVVQSPPVLLDRDATLVRLLQHIDEAVGAGASLLVFPETWVPGYPSWIWRLRPGGDMSLTAQIHAAYRENAVDLSAGHLEPVCEAALKHRVTVVLGINEVDSEFSRTTLFNTVVVVGPDGTILNRHRKLMPTNPERMVWGMGDASGLRVVETPVGRVATLICWENYMPLARYALYAQGAEIFIAPTWDAGSSWIASMQHIAKEGGCWVIGTATAMQGKDVPDGFPGREQLFADPEEWINDGDAVVVRPMGTIVAGPHTREKSILYADVDPEAARRARRSLDVCGHYSRPDVFDLTVNRGTLPPVRFTD